MKQMGLGAAGFECKTKRTRKREFLDEMDLVIATGAKLLGGITIGDHSIIGANAVVVDDVPPFSVVARNPAKIISMITKENLPKYASYLYKGIPLKDIERIMFEK